MTYLVRTSLALMAALSLESVASAESASDIMGRAQSVLRAVADKTMLVTLHVQNQSGDERVRSLRAFEKKTAEGRKILWVFESPTELSGTSFLSWQRPSERDLLWVYFPGQRRVRQLPPQVRREQFQGSAFTYDDLAIFYFDFHGRYSLEGEKPCGGATCYLVQTDLDDGSFAYHRLLAWIRADTFLPERVEFFEDKLLKVMTVQRAETVQGIPTVLELEMEDVRDSYRTKVECQNVAYNTGLEDGLFTVGHLIETGH
jgi:hypothetical protein